MNKCLDSITKFIFVEDDITPCDIILIPGGSHPQLAERAAYLYNQGKAKLILASGRANPNIPEFASEAEFLKSISVNMGVPNEKFICENEASHTFENAEFSLTMLNNMNLKHDRIILVCKAYHSRRSLLTYQYFFPKNTEFLVSPTTDKRGLHKDNWTTNPEYIEKVMGEVEKIGKYFKDKVAYLDGCAK